MLSLIDQLAGLKVRDESYRWVALELLSFIVVYRSPSFEGVVMTIISISSVVGGSERDSIELGICSDMSRSP